MGFIPVIDIYRKNLKSIIKSGIFSRCAVSALSKYDRVIYAGETNRGESNLYMNRKSPEYLYVAFIKNTGERMIQTWFNKYMTKSYSMYRPAIPVSLEEFWSVQFNGVLNPPEWHGLCDSDSLRKYDIRIYL